MRLLLSGDDYCCLLNGKFYVSETGRTHIFRYLKAFDNILVAFRTKKVNSANELEKYSLCIEDERVKFIDIPFFQGPIQFFKSYSKIISVLRNSVCDCDFAILRLPSTIAFAALKIVRAKKIPYATEIVFDCIDAADNSDSILQKMIWKLLHNMQAKACKNALGVSCVTEFYLQKHYYPQSKESITSHYSSIELTDDFFFHPRNYPAKQIITLIHIANQVQYNGRKGHNELIDVIAKLNEQGKNAEIVFIGEDYQNGIAQLNSYANTLGVGDSVHFTGYLNKKQLRTELEKADIAVLPTRAEGLPRVVIECMALGLPCITSPVSGNPELINRPFLIGYNDVIGMANACNNLINNPALYESESADNFAKSKKYAKDILDKRRTSFYNQLIAIVEKRSKS